MLKAKDLLLEAKATITDYLAHAKTKLGEDSDEYKALRDNTRGVLSCIRHKVACIELKEVKSV